eukprot:766649-Hanusia_phi.AAC.2
MEISLKDHNSLNIEELEVTQTSRELHTVGEIRPARDPMIGWPLQGSSLKFTVAAIIGAAVPKFGQVPGVQRFQRSDAQGPAALGCGREAEECMAVPVVG